MEEIFMITGKVVLITGCSSGLGKALCRKLTKQGGIVAATARNTEKLSDVCADLKAELDVTDPESVKAAVNRIISEFGRIDILVNNAGYSVRSAVEEMDLQDTRNMFEVNVFGMIRMIQAVAPHMRQQGCGKILNIGSVSGRMTGIINGGYCASKHAVEALTEAARYELSDFGIQVAVVEPGAMDTDFFHTLEQNSQIHMENAQSPYRALYQRDIAYRRHQKRKNIDAAAREIVAILEKKKWKTRYTAVLPWIFQVFIHLPDGIKERLIWKFN